MEAFARLYKRAATGATLQWWIEVDGDRYRSHSGQVGGVVTTTEWTRCAGKNIGRANATTAEQQALRDAKSKWQRKQDREQFSADLNAPTTKFVAPMLAQNYDDRKDELDFSQGVWVQCKLNGARCIASRNGLFSRKGSKWESVPHISRALEHFFELHPDVVLDGELFNEELRQDLGSIISLISKKKITPEDLNKSQQMVQYHVYDVVDTVRDYKSRLELLKDYVLEINNPCIRVVQTIQCLNTSEIDRHLQLFERQGHEGAIVRSNGVYENKRSKHLLKYKSFTDSEFVIVGVIEGEGNLAGKIGAFVLEDARGMRFNSSPTGSHAYWEQMWRDRDQLVGKQATVKYKELTPEKNGKGGVPSFGKVIAIRDYES